MIPSNIGSPTISPLTGPLIRGDEGPGRGSRVPLDSEAIEDKEWTDAGLFESLQLLLNGRLQSQGHPSHGCHQGLLVCQHLLDPGSEPVVRVNSQSASLQHANLVAVHQLPLAHELLQATHNHLELTITIEIRKEQEEEEAGGRRRQEAGGS